MRPVHLVSLAEEKEGISSIQDEAEQKGLEDTSAVGEMSSCAGVQIRKNVRHCTWKVLSFLLNHWHLLYVAQSTTFVTQ